MGKKHQHSAAARARAARWNPTAVPVPSPSPEAVDDSEPLIQQCEDTEPHDYFVIESDSCSECEYTGGVNVDSSDSDYKPGDLDWETELTDDTLSELSGDELEENMRMLQAESAIEADLLAQPAAFEKIAMGVSSAAWKKAEKNRGLGYNGQSQQTYERRGQQAQAAAKVRENAKKSYVSSQTEWLRTLT
ncbi:uncharacterized protein F5891DRAFT_987041 [Suillus fuscotomentosus]|uniref:Uncharacterized protein n=1 Tax=Suillus fuscotomentosus TaxID=1912939 RepID=A0AAD4HE67_9AGAM|nr:uncharacterized protein F5891DRAFT_987041 [Suillus fuscotomentosus]KAG1890509.1 hypothetical protein F5891DRAFT_987041 [Suillus fuscotomentosus]